MAAALTPLRLKALGLASPRFDAPEAVVAHLGAVQAQDWYGSLWAIGARMRRPREADVERALAARRIVRTWPMRGTLHFVAAADVRWMLALLAPRVVAANRARIEREHGLHAGVLGRARKIVERALRDGAPMPRNALCATLEAGGIHGVAQRGIHITGWLALQGVLCGGPRDGRQPTFVLLDAWVPATPALARDEALAALALRYFKGHGPATVQDFAWWSGLTVADAQAAQASVAAQLDSLTIEGRAHWHASGLRPTRSKAAHLLPAFDEYLVGYRDRSAMVDAARMRQVVAINGLVSPTIVVDGRVVGLWKRVLGKDAVTITPTLFRALDAAERGALARAARRYATFLDAGNLSIGSG